MLRWRRRRWSWGIRRRFRNHIIIIICSFSLLNWMMWVTGEAFELRTLTLISCSLSATCMPPLLLLCTPSQEPIHSPFSRKCCSAPHLLTFAPAPAVRWRSLVAGWLGCWFPQSPDRRLMTMITGISHHHPFPSLHLPGIVLESSTYTHQRNTSGSLSIRRISAHLRSCCGLAAINFSPVNYNDFN